MSKSESEARGRQHTLEKLLLELGLGDLDLDGLVDLLLVSALVVGIVLDGGGEESVDESSLSEARLASDLLELVPGQSELVTHNATYHDSEGSSTLRDNLVPDQMLGRALSCPTDI